MPAHRALRPCDVFGIDVAAIKMSATVLAPVEKIVLRVPGVVGGRAVVASVTLELAVDHVGLICRLAEPPRL